MGNPNFFNQVLIENNLRQSLLRDISLKLFKSIDSTNNQAKEFVQRSLDQKNESKDLIIFAADSQLTGRGRRGHNWLSSDPASIAVSFLFQAKNNIDQIPQITAAASLAVKETFKIFDLETNLKWPNDILVDNKKICGILSELVFNAQKDTFVIIGCGINLNNTEFSSEIKKIATSYYLEKNKRIDKNIFLAKLIEQLNFYIKNYLSGSREMILASWKKELDLVGKKLDFEFKNKKYTGIIRDILDSGELLVAFENGQNKKLQSVNTSLDYQSLDKYNND
ncbi:BirA family biotin operon repressor/biotin-[acetyl-CoA-carboxylase] ligase [Halanaerobium saccharolyticum]|uniref:BirA family biotin operon repressor/biotin-[acetyl-CoA-carboxylase] ligase n=1 Tax=Halanaerobium saccharolyticum TaxID=43595 RepID=A0A4R7YQ69_9FIRM|nr:biotin--[acetyl-CoA-carboxylase] ligase [Halanaerobium saccharolyticum]RAK05112.1 BirA family biotin operon repressor/biotin-[acetyl-CoA-carboxylase] ligase [Halanaerobium saccharolyticum]TDV98879.1 BirA family biotin operon repressor/biotin-[acetyl-CoA-carboxylase] ligase [Halanaerobium saccharolyticum]TDX51581.1 BirA family biotin operon repressor/biotin-[acetyl-CoA-carboxylase] ligase [Halanaerobium saccharolyticum]